MCSRRVACDPATARDGLSGKPTTTHSPSIAGASAMRVTLPFLCLGVVAASGLASAATNLPALKAERWVNTKPLTAETLRGKVVLVDFWEYTCVNWIRTAPYAKAWNRDYGSLG